MVLTLDAKASSLSEIVLWMGTVIAAAILLYFYLNNFFFSAKPFEKVSGELEQIASAMNEACGTTSFSTKYNPDLEEGTLMLKDKNICIEALNVKKCSTGLCRVSVDKNIDLKKTKALIVTKREGESALNVTAENV